MVTFLFGVAIAFNILFGILWVYGMYLDKRFKREANRLVDTHIMRSESFNNWKYEA